MTPEEIAESGRERGYRRRVREGIARSLHVHGIVNELVKEGNSIEWTHRGFKYKVTIEKEKMK